MNMRIHISLPVISLEKSIDFYERLFGQPVTKLRNGYANFRLDQPPVHLALVQAGQNRDVSGGSTPKESIGHLGIELPDVEMFNRWYDRLESSGLRGREEKDVVCCYARGEKVWVSDPDGNEWEIWVRTADAEQMLGSQEACCAA